MSGKRSGLSIKDKMCVLEKYDALPKMSQREAASVLNMARTTLSKILKSRQDLETKMKSAAATNHNRKRNRTGKNKAVEDALKMWFCCARASNVPINGPILRQKAKDFSKEMGFGDFTASEGWLDRWKKRENIVYHSQKTNQLEPKDGDKEIAARNWIREEWPRIAAQYPSQDIYGADETGLYFRALPENVKGSRKKDMLSMERIVVLCCVSMTGENKQLLVVGKSKRPKCIHLPTRYVSNENAWMTGAIFTDWLTSWNVELRQEGRSICLLVDNCTAHNLDTRLSNIEMRILPSLMQPCVIVRNLKMQYRCEMRSRIERCLEDADSDSVSAYDIAKTITLVDAMHMLAKSWGSISPADIQSCFCHALLAEKPDRHIDGAYPVIIPAGMTESEFEDWIAVDDNVPVASFLSESDLSIVNKIQKNSENPENSEKEMSDHEEDSDPVPTAKQMRAALRTIRFGLERRGFSDFASYYKFEDLVEGALTESSQIKFKEPDPDGIRISSDLPGLVYLMQMTTQPMNAIVNHH